MAERAALQHRAPARNAAQLSRRRAATGRAHCLEAALAAAVILEQHGYPPLVMSIESKDWLDHVVFLYRAARRWGAIARSRDPGLARPQSRFPLAARHGAQLRRGLRGLHRPRARLRRRQSRRGAARLRLALFAENVWKVEQLLIDWPHRKIKTSERERYRALLTRYIAYRERYGRKPWRYYSRPRPVDAAADEFR